MCMCGDSFCPSCGVAQGNDPEAEEEELSESLIPDDISTFRWLASKINSSWMYSMHWSTDGYVDTLSYRGYNEALRDCEKEILHTLRRLDGLQKAKAEILREMKSSLIPLDAEIAPELEGLRKRQREFSSIGKEQFEDAVEELRKVFFSAR